jgi:shikimate kinase
MGAGKTTVGRVLAQKLGYDFIDLDDLIEARVGKSVQAIFGEMGEHEFRRLERDAIHWCKDIKRTVIALGGGAYVAEQNRALLHAIGKTVWLDCPLEVCLRRIRDDKSRPLLGDEDEMRTLLEQRRAAYVQADYVLRTGELLPEQLAVEITCLVGK